MTTGDRAGASPGRRWWLAAELVLLFGVMPWWYSGAPMREWGLGIWPPILLGFGGCLAALLLDPGFDRRQLWNRRGVFIGARGMIFRLAIAAVVLTAATWFFERERFFAFPLQAPVVWIIVMVAYPVFSVYPQEVIFRTFFVHRYGALLEAVGGRWLLIGVGAAAFGWAHVIFGATAFATALAVILSAIGGVLFLSTYLRTRSTFAASLEHALYGDLLFTIGLGWYFYSGSVNG